MVYDQNYFNLYRLYSMRLFVALMVLTGRTFAIKSEYLKYTDELVTATKTTLVNLTSADDFMGCAVKCMNAMACDGFHVNNSDVANSTGFCTLLEGSNSIQDQPGALLFMKSCKA
jgi:hypothetical protein